MSVVKEKSIGYTVRPGYKQTELGIVPAEWETYLLEEISERISVGLATSVTKHYRRSGVPIVRNLNIKDGFFDGSDMLYISPEFANANATKAAKAYDVLTVHTGSNLGQTCVLPIEFDNCQTFTTLITTPKKRIADPYFLCLHMSSEFGRNEMARLQAGGGKGNLNTGELKKYRIAIPPRLNEQLAIASALSDVDGLLGVLERMITKKRDLKQAAMQQLLTGQTRLPGFASTKHAFQSTTVGIIPADWILRPLRDIVVQSRGIRYGIVQPGRFDPNGRLMIRGQDYSKGWVEPDDMFRVSPEVEEKYRNARVVTGDLIITIVGAGTGHVELIPSWLDDANLTQTTARIAIDAHHANGEFVKYMLETPVGIGQVANFMKGAAQPGLNCGDIDLFLVPLPALAEQTAIAEVLTDMDAEIAALEQRRDKTRDLKQGMMQELLTGKTRLC